MFVLLFRLPCAVIFDYYYYYEFCCFSDGVSGYDLIIIFLVCEFCCFSGGVRGYVFN